MNANGQIDDPALDRMSMFILDVLRHDLVEQIPSILNLLNDDGCVGWHDCWPQNFTIDPIVPSLEKLVRAGFVGALREQEAGSDLPPVNLQDFRCRARSGLTLF